MFCSLSGNGYSSVLGHIVAAEYVVGLGSMPFTKKLIQMSHNPAGCRSEMMSLGKSLNMHGSENCWIASLQSLQATQNMSGVDDLLLLKSMVSFVKSTQVLGNLVRLFVRNMSAQIEDRGILSDEKLALQMLNIVKDFWSLMSSQHVMITQQAYGRYSAVLYEVLPSLASVYIDLLIAVHSTKSTVSKAAKRLYSWLMFELNERCIQTALLEASGCTTAGARLVLPVLRTVLSSSSDNTNNLDYLLHFILLKRWSFVCADLGDLIQVSSSMKAPGGFLEWLVQHWSKAVEYLPSDKSLKGRRISEFLLELDQQAVEELTDVFSEALSVEQPSEQQFEHTHGVNKKSADQVMPDELFFIDKRRNDMAEEQLKTGQKFLKKEQRETGIKKDIHVGIKNKRHSGSIMSSGYFNDNICSKTQDEGTRNNKDNFMDVSFEESANVQTENVQQLKKKKLSHIEKDGDNISGLLCDNISKTQAIPLENKDRKTACTLAVEANEDGDESETMDHERDSAWQGTGRAAVVPASQVGPEIVTDATRSTSVDSGTDKEHGSSNNVRPSTRTSKTLRKYKDSPKSHRNLAVMSTGTGDTSPVSIDTQHSSSPQLTNEPHTVLSSEETSDSTSYLSISAHSSFAGQIIRKNKQHTNLKARSLPTGNFTETEREIADAAQPFEDTKIGKGIVNTTDSSKTECKVGMMLSAIRKSGERKRKAEDETDAFHVKTRLRTKSESTTQSGNSHTADNLAKTRSRKPLITAAADSFKDWLRQSPSSLLKDQSSPKHFTPASQVQTKSPIQKVKDSTAVETDSFTATRKLDEVFGTPLKTYSRKDRMKIATCKTGDNSTPDSPKIKHKSPTKTREKSEQRRYFLRTNCSHRLRSTDKVCPSCSPSTKG